MAKPDWHYEWRRDLTVWMLILPGALGAVVAAIWIPVVWNTAAVAIQVGQEIVFALLFVLPVCFMLLWTFAWWAAAARRVFRIRRLIQTGVPVQANVEKLELSRHDGSITAVTLWLEYELDGVRFNIKKKTSWRKVIPPARDLQRIELAVDPESPKYVAFVVDDRLG